MITVNYIASVILIVLGLGIIDYGVNLLTVSIGWNDVGTAPIYTMSDLLNGVASRFFVDPVPQALTLTSIVIGACVTAMAISLVIMIYRKYKTLDANEIRRIRG